MPCKAGRSNPFLQLKSRRFAAYLAQISGFCCVLTVVSFIIIRID